LALPSALTHGFSVAFLTGAILAALGAAVTLLGFGKSSHAPMQTRELELAVVEAK
jgi:hypothetical protein